MIDRGFKTSQPMWNEVEEIREPKCRTADDHLERRRRQLCLAEIELPEGFTLVTPRPKQFWMLNQLVWGFCLAWQKLDKHGRPIGDEFRHIARYFPQVNDDVQMRWALEDFRRDIEAEQTRAQRVITDPLRAHSFGKAGLRLAS